MCVQVAMNDRDVIEHAAKLVGRAIVQERRHRTGFTAGKTSYRLSIRGHLAMVLAEKVLPYMGERRSARIIELLSEYGDHGAIVV